MNILDTTKKRRGRAVIAAALVLAMLSGLLIGCANNPDDKPKPSGEDTYDVNPGSDPEVKAVKLPIISIVVTESGVILEDASVSLDEGSEKLTVKWHNTYEDTESIYSSYCVSHATRNEEGVLTDEILPEAKVEGELLPIMAGGTSEMTFDLSAFTFNEGEIYRVYLNGTEPTGYSVAFKYLNVADMAAAKDITSPAVTVKDGFSAAVTKLDMTEGAQELTVSMKNCLDRTVSFDPSFYLCRLKGKTVEKMGGSPVYRAIPGNDFLHSGESMHFTYCLSSFDFTEGEVYRVYLNNGESGDCHVDFRYESGKIYDEQKTDWLTHGTDTVSVSVDDFIMQYGAEHITVEWKNNGTDDFVQNFDFAVYHNVGDEYERMADNDLLFFPDGANILSPDTLPQTTVDYDFSEIEFTEGDQYRIYLNGKAETDFRIDFTYNRTLTSEPDDEWAMANRTVPAKLPKYHQGDTEVWSPYTAFNMLGLGFTPDHRAVFFSGHEQLRSLVSAAEYDAWCKEAIIPGVEGEMTAVSFIKHFGITREQFDSVIKETTNGATEKEETLNGDILYTFDDYVISFYYSRRAARDLTTIPVKGELVTTLDGLAKLGLPEDDSRTEYIRAFVTGDTDKIIELNYVGYGWYGSLSAVPAEEKAMFDPYRTLKISEWRAWAEDNDGYKHVYFEFFPTYSDIERFKAGEWNTGYEIVPGMMAATQLRRTFDENVPGEASAEVAKMFGRFFSYDMPKTLSGTAYNPYAIVKYICLTLPAEEQTEEKVNAFAKKYFGIDNIIPEGKKIEDYNLAQGGTTIYMNTVAAEDQPDGSVKVTVQFYADWSKTIKSHTINYTVKKIDGYFALTGYEEVYISPYAPVSFSV